MQLLIQISYINKTFQFAKTWGSNCCPWILSRIRIYHHGIFISHKEGVIEFGGDDKTGATVKLVDLLKFTNNRKRDLIRERYRLPSMCFQPNVVVKNAKLLLKNPQHLPPYNLMLFNCEHFATYCKTGILKSNQCGFLWKIWN